MSLSERERTEILGAIRKHVLKNHINVGGVNYDAWFRLMEERTPTLLAGDTEAFESGIQQLLLELGGSRGDLTTNSFVVINKTMDENRRRRIVVANLGNAEALLESRDHFRSLAKRLLQRGVVPFDDERWDGWLGRYHETLREAVFDLDEPKARSRKRSVKLER